jgi:hypothetical protein
MNFYFYSQDSGYLLNEMLFSILKLPDVSSTKSQVNAISSIFHIDEKEIDFLQHVKSLSHIINLWVFCQFPMITCMILYRD